MSYFGPFTSEYRDEIKKKMVTKVHVDKVPYTIGFEFSDFLVGPATVWDWNMEGLPTDKFSKDNGVIAKKANRWPLMIDPQSQGLHWIKQNEKNERWKAITIADIKNPQYIKVIEDCIKKGKSCLMPDVGQELDPVLDNVLSKAYKQ